MLRLLKYRLLFVLWCMAATWFLTSQAKAGHDSYDLPPQVEQALVIPHPSNPELLYLCGPPFQSILGKKENGDLILGDIQFDCDIIRRPDPNKMERCLALTPEQGFIYCSKSI